MISVSSNALALKDGREAQVLRHLILRDDIIRTFRLSDDKLANLEVYVSIAYSRSLSAVGGILT
jgi:hypothetical protein